MSEQGERNEPQKRTWYDEKGRLMHYCHCGKWGDFGVGVFPKEDKLGLWYCREHAADGGFIWR